MGINSFFSNNFETSDETTNQTLKTHYYNNTYDNVKDAIRQVANTEKLNIINTDNVYHEILLEGKRFELIITCTKVSYMETGIDMKISTHHLFPASRGLKHIGRIYSEFDRLLRFKRLGQ